MRWYFGTVCLLMASVMPMQHVAAQDSPPEAEAATAEATRYFLFIGKIGPEGWKLAERNSTDLRERVEGEIEQLGGTVVGYYFGAFDTNNYVIVSLPDTKTAKAIQILRMSSGLLLDYNVIELIDSADMPSVMEFMETVRSVDGLELEE